MLNRRVVVTGVSVLTPIGDSNSAYWHNLLEGVSGVREITDFNVSDYRTKIAASINVNIKDLLIGYGIKKVDKLERVACIGIATAIAALKDAGIGDEQEMFDTGVVIGSGVGGMMYYESQILEWLSNGPKTVHPTSILRITPNTISSNIAITLKCHGPDLTISTACSSGSHAIGIAYLHIKNGIADRFIAGGAETPNVPVLFAAFDNMKVMSKRNDDPGHACRPFDTERDGFVLGEGAAMLIIESLDLAQKRGASIYGEIVGYGQSSGAYHMVIPAPDGLGESAAINRALTMAQLDSSEIDYINAHGTGTVSNDVSETKAIWRVFKSYADQVDVSSNKGQTGHLVGASGALGAATTLLSMKNGVLSSNSNLLNIDPLCKLNILKEPKRKKIRAAVSNSFGFGNNNASLVFKRI